MLLSVCLFCVFLQNVCGEGRWERSHLSFRDPFPNDRFDAGKHAGAGILLKREEEEGFPDRGGVGSVLIATESWCIRHGAVRIIRDFVRGTGPSGPLYFVSDASRNRSSESGTQQDAGNDTGEAAEHPAYTAHNPSDNGSHYEVCYEIYLETRTPSGVISVFLCWPPSRSVVVRVLCLVRD